MSKVIGEFRFDVGDVTILAVRPDPDSYTSRFVVVERVVVESQLGLSLVYKARPTNPIGHACDNNGFVTFYEFELEKLPSQREQDAIRAKKELDYREELQREVRKRENIGNENHGR